MGYRINVPLERDIQFPDRCPFSDEMSPTGKVQLKRNSTSIVLPLPGGFLNSHSSTALQLPAAKKIATLAVTFQILMWLSILGGMAVPVILMGIDAGDNGRYAILFIAGGLLAALGFRIARWFVLRRVKIGNAWNGFLEMVFASETFAREFSELNRLSLEAT